MTNLFLEIERAETEFNEVSKLQEAIIELSRNDVAALVLTMALRDAAVNCENIWRNIEEREDFVAKYGDDRAKAREDYLRDYFSKE